MEVQITVLVRLVVMQINAIRDVVNMPPLDFEELEGLFKEFADLRQRPDWKNHLRAWYSGEDLSNLPEIPDLMEEAIQMPDPTAEGVVGSGSYLDVEDFGGDYGNDDERNEIDPDPSGSLPEAEVGGAESEVPQVWDDDPADSGSVDGEGDSAMPEVSDPGSDEPDVGPPAA